MQPLFDHHTERRQADLRVMQGLPVAIPEGFTAARKSNFARPRRTILICLAVLAAAIAYANSEPTEPQQRATRTRVVYASGMASTLSGVEFGPCTQSNSHSASSSGFTHDGKGSHESMSHGFRSSWFSSACRTSSTLAESTVNSDNRLL